MFFSKNLLIDWCEGECWFMCYFIDGDLVVNNGGWQWSVFIGIDVVFYFCLFNLFLQFECFDLCGEFICYWLLELVGLECKVIYDLFSLGLFVGVDYLWLMVDLKVSCEWVLVVFCNLLLCDGCVQGVLVSYCFLLNGLFFLQGGVVWWKNCRYEKVGMNLVFFVCVDQIGILQNRLQDLILLFGCFRLVLEQWIV